LSGGWLYSRYEPIQSAADCTSVETFDPTNSTCYYECETEEACARLAKQVDTELDAFFKNSQTKSNEQAGDGRPADSKNEVIFTNGNGILQPKPNNRQAALWALFQKIASNDISKQTVDTFSVFDDDQNATAAAVWRSEQPKKWHVTVNQAYDNEPKDLIHTLVHEYGHILTLSEDQVPSAVTGSCPTLSLQEGCAAQSAYITEFSKRYWQRYDKKAPKNDGEDQDEVQRFYNQNGKDQTFVSEYAATNLTEDMAESFASFVLQSKPSGTKTVDKKIAFYYEYPALVRERERIRTALAKELGSRQMLRTTR
jgi:hypothetical protein